jgi:hypothetical protein
VISIDARDSALKEMISFVFEFEQNARFSAKTTVSPIDVSDSPYRNKRFPEFVGQAHSAAARLSV